MDVTIIGGGLVGALCGRVLGERGHNVSLFELRDDPKSEKGKLAKGRSINLALSTRGRDALARVGLEEKVLQNAIPMKGRLIHAKDCSTKEHIYDPLQKECIWSVSRSYLNSLLLEEAAKMPNVHVNFNHQLSDIDLETGSLKFKNESGKEIQHKANLIIGADGAHSATRGAMIKKSMTNFNQTYIEHGYMELCIPPNKDGTHAAPKNYLHIWPRERFMLIALPNQDGSFTVTLFMPFAIFSSLTNPEQILQFFRTEFPDALELIGEARLVQDFMNSRPSALISIKCKPLNYGRAVLIGDAAHAMVPFYGQGMNAGFEDVSILDDLLSNVHSSKINEIEFCLSRFSEKRADDAQAICELAMYNYVEMRHLVNQKGYCFRRFLDSVLFKFMGNRWMPLYSAVTFSKTPYAKCISDKKWQDEVISSATRIAKTSVIIAGFIAVISIYWKANSSI